jgi:DNA-binding MarR family transcriptional regulator
MHHPRPREWVRADRNPGLLGPLTTTRLAEILELPLSTVAFRVRRLERRDHAERIGNPADGRSFLIRLTPQRRTLLNKVRPRFRSYAEAVESRLGGSRTKGLRQSLVELRQAIDDELAVRSPVRAGRS